MNLQLVEKIARAVLYEGYILYPYRPSAVKNRQRFNFGVLTPRSYSEAQGGTESWQMQTECLLAARLEGDEEARLEVRVRFLHLTAREAASSPEGGRSEEAGMWENWQEAIEREIGAADLELRSLIAAPRIFNFTFPAEEEAEPLPQTGEGSAPVPPLTIRRRQSIDVALEVAAEEIGPGLCKVRVLISNPTPFAGAAGRRRDEALASSLLSTHTILGARGGEFVSLLDPPRQLRAAAAACRNRGAWPVLVGEDGERDLMLSSPIILYDYPQLAPESAGDLCDGTEIDEILLLRIMTLTEEEKREMRAGDERAREILERTESLPPEQLMKLHGAWRSLKPRRDDDQRMGSEPAP